MSKFKSVRLLKSYLKENKEECEKYWSEVQELNLPDITFSGIQKAIEDSKIIHQALKEGKTTQEIEKMYGIKFVNPFLKQ